MSRWHENVVWQSKDGTWSRGFNEVSSRPDDPDDEWGVEFDDNTFEWVSSGHATADAAYASWDGVNPGGSSEIRHSSERPKDTLRLDVMAAELEERDAARAHGRWGYRNYNGPSLANRPDILRARLDKLDAELRDIDRSRLYYGLNGYANNVSRQATEATAQRDAVLAQIDALGGLTDSERQERESHDDLARLANLVKLDEARSERNRSRSRSRYGSYGGGHRDSAEQIEAGRRLEADLAEVRARVSARQAAAAPPPSATTPPADRPTSAAGPQGRVGKGVPSGGQFATAPRAEADVEL